MITLLLAFAFSGLLVIICMTLLKRAAMRANWSLVVDKILTHSNHDDLAILFKKIGKYNKKKN